MFKFLRKKKDELVKISVNFKGDTSVDTIEKFLNEFVVGGFLDIKDICQMDILDKQTRRLEGIARVAQCITTRKNFNIFRREFGNMFQEGWY